MTSLVDYVVDTTIVVQHLITDVHTPHVDVLFDALGDSVMLYLPEFCLLECGNVLWKRVRFHGMPQKDAEGLIETLIALPFKVIPVSGLLKRGLQIGCAHQLAVYDAMFIVLAEQIGAALITDDVKQEQAARRAGIAIKPIADF